MSKAPKHPSIELPATWRRKNLSPAEQRVVELVGSGLPTKIAAAQLCRSPLTVRNQLKNAMRKLGIANRYELIARLHRISASKAAQATERDENNAYSI